MWFCGTTGVKDSEVDSFGQGFKHLQDVQFQILNTKKPNPSKKVAGPRILEVSNKNQAQARNVQHLAELRTGRVLQRCHHLSSEATDLLDGKLERSTDQKVLHAAHVAKVERVVPASYTSTDAEAPARAPAQ